MKVEIDLDELILKAATAIMDDAFTSEWRHIVEALQQQIPEDVQLMKLVRQQVKEYKKLTMWR